MRSSLLFVTVASVSTLLACADPSEGDSDAAPVDAAVADSGRSDSGVPDGGAISDAGRLDLGAVDTGPSDAGSGDVGATTDAEVEDAAAPDATAPDAANLGPALHFDGVDDQLLIPAATGGFNELAFSEESWFRTGTSSVVILEVYSMAQLGSDRALFLRGGVVCFYVYSPVRTEHCTTARYDDGVWHHVAGTLGPGGMTLYIDGALEVNDPNTTQSAFNWDTALRAGYGHIGADTELRYMAGDLDEIRVWSVERTEAEIRDNYRRSVDPATVGLVGYWKLDETGTATAATDSTTAANDGVLSGFSNLPSPWITDGAF